LIPPGPSAEFCFDSGDCSLCPGFKKTRFFSLKKPNPVGFLGFIGFFGQAGKMGKIIQKLSNLKP